MNVTVMVRISSVSCDHINSTVHDSANLPPRFAALSTKCDSRTAGAMATARYSNRQP